MGCILDRGNVLNTTEENFNFLHEVFEIRNHLDKMNFDEDMRRTKIMIADSSEHVNDVINDLNQRNEVLSGLRNIKCSCKAPDPDGIHHLMLKNTGPHFISPMIFLFNICLEKGSRTKRKSSYGKLLKVITKPPAAIDQLPSHHMSTSCSKES